jgi:hypothetical protein
MFTCSYPFLLLILRFPFLTRLKRVITSIEHADPYGPFRGRESDLESRSRILPSRRLHLRG